MHSEEEKKNDDGHLVEVMREKWRTARLARFLMCVCVLASLFFPS
jgi:hypothetical protein